LGPLFFEVFLKDLRFFTENRQSECNNFAYFSVLSNKKALRRFTLTLLSLLMLPLLGNATHYRAGEITYRQIRLLTYEITAVTYTDPRMTGADRPSIEIDLGDNTIKTVDRINGNGTIIRNDANNQIKKNIYRTTHTYSGPGKYLISLEDPNRIAGIRNINNGQSVEIPFYVESYLNIISGNYNESPVLLLPPIDVGCRNRIFTHNPAAYDPDGDSLSFTLIPPKRGRGQDVQNYTTPFFSDSFSLDVNNGQVTWTTPQIGGPYNIAIKIQEFRKGILIGFVVRDMQIFIYDNCINRPPAIVAVQDTCIEAGELLRKTITATDPDGGQRITLEPYGGPFVQVVSPATLGPNNEGISPLNSTFNWKPSCYAIRHRSHQAVFRATDNNQPDGLTDIRFWNIKVVGPAPRNLRIVQDSNGFRLNWTADSCGLAYGYKIYRRIDSSNWKHARCETGVPAYTGFTLLDTTSGLLNTSYFDNQFGRGLSPLIRYCYVVTTMYPPRSENGNLIFSEETESYASDEVCDLILRTKPILTKASVETTSESNGKIRVEWLNPNQLDTVDQFPPPYRSEVVRAFAGTTNFVSTGTSINYPNFVALNQKGSLLDSNLNTQTSSYDYKIVFYYTKDGSEKRMDESVPGSTVFLKNYDSDKSILLNWSFQVPWNNKLVKVFKKNQLGTFDSIGISSSGFFTDQGLENGKTYCYKVETIGNYDTAFFNETILNFSQEICGTPVDTIAPCPPVLTIDTPCNNFNTFKVGLKWGYPGNCDQDVVEYRIYWKKNQKDTWTLLGSIPATSSSWDDNRAILKQSIAGCYAVSAIDSNGNESKLQNTHCIDNCPYYTLPNVFTPGEDDDVNSKFVPFPYRFISKVNVQIFNRWGQLVFETSNPDIMWNGKDQKSGIDCAAGVYYYIGEITESYLTGEQNRTIRGSIHLIR